jgi:hypothetical protein
MWPCQTEAVVVSCSVHLYFFTRECPVNTSNTRPYICNNKNTDDVFCEEVWQAAGCYEYQNKQSCSLKCDKFPDQLYEQQTLKSCGHWRDLLFCLCLGWCNRSTQHVNILSQTHYMGDMFRLYHLAIIRPHRETHEKNT